MSMKDKAMSSSRKKRGQKEIKFDPEARKGYLRGFSERKRERRAYGLAMQKIKDRKAKLEDRKEAKQAELETIEDAERKKKIIMESMALKSTKDNSILSSSYMMERESDDDDKNAYPSQHKSSTTKVYQDDNTQSQFGGNVIVTTTLAPFSDESSNEEDADSDDDTEKDKDAPPKKKPAHLRDQVDTEQQYAGYVGKYLNQFKGKMPSKKKTKNDSKAKGGSKLKGKHGAANMAGMGSGSDLKLSKRLLKTSTAKHGNGKGDANKKSRFKGGVRR